MKTSEDLLKEILKETKYQSSKKHQKTQKLIKKLKKKNKYLKNKNKNQEKSLSECQKKRSAHWDSYMSARSKLDQFEKKGQLNILQKSGVLTFSLATKPFMQEKYSKKLKEAPVAYFNDAKNTTAVTVGNLLGLRNTINNKKNQLNLAQKAGISSFAFVARSFMQDRFYQKLKQTPVAYFVDAKNPTAVAVGSLLGLRNRNLLFIPTKEHKVPGKIKEIRKIKVALICDEFSYNSFKYEFSPIIIEPDNWREKFNDQRPDVFFCESAWSGIDTKRRPWQGKVYTSINFMKENRTELFNILKYCKQNNVPTIFWNKEDPTHFDDKVHDFISTAEHFDYVFTTDEDCISRYKKEYKCKNVFCLPFATQPKLFNPIEKNTRNNKVVFAGSWYKHHEERSKDMETIFNNILASGKELDIYDRCYHLDDEDHFYPERYRTYTKPPVNHDEINEIYKSSLFGLNINTVKESATMFARRVYELASSNTFILSNHSVGVEKLLGNNVIFADREPDKLAKLTSQTIEKARDENLHLALEKHSYYERFRFILDTISFPYIPVDSSITVVCVANEESDIPIAVEAYKAQKLHSKKCLIVLADGMDPLIVASLYTKFNKFDICVASLHYLKTYPNNWNNIIRSRYFALIDFNKKAERNDYIHRAYLHTSYINNSIIMNSINDNKKYTFSSTAIIKDILAPKDQFKKLLLNHGKIIEGDFYHV